MLDRFAFTIICVLAFLYGFFPVNKNDSTQTFDIRQEIGLGEAKLNGTYHEHYNKVVLIVIDALRLDFLNEHNFPFTTSKIKENGCMLDVKVECPTVTLPRIKSLTTGSVPQFIDIVLNFGDAGSLKDSLLHVLKRYDKKIVFYGDDTWLKLYKDDIFVRSEGTTSFFVNDFYQVDDNVTRNLNLELERDDWDMMILHYLGLDHIGHVYGPRSPLIPEKLNEMDNIIKQTYTKLITNTSKTLILITGDHGMMDSGGHGGSTYSETHVPLVMLGTPCQNDTISQTDIPVNLAVLMAVDIPSTSIGLIKRSMLKVLSLKQYLYALRYNALMLLSKMDLCKDKHDLATKYHASLHTSNIDLDAAKKAEELYRDCSYDIHDALLKSSTQQNLEILFTSILNLIYIFVTTLVSLIPGEKSGTFDLLVIIPNVSHFVLGNIVFALGIILAIIINVIPLYKFLSNMNFKHRLHDKFLVAVFLIQPLTLASSSFIEEEHQIWYFVLSTVIFLYIVGRISPPSVFFKSIGLFILIRFARTINQTGDKWSSLPDFADFLLEEGNSIFLTMFYLSSMVILFCLQNSMFLKRKVNKLNLLINILCYALLILSHIFPEQKTALQRIVWCIIFIQMLLCLCSFSDILDVWLSICILLLKPYNIFLVIVCLLTSNFLSYKTSSQFKMDKFRYTVQLTLSHLCLERALFFMQGHSNSLASVDVAVGYTALESYHPVMVVTQTLLHVFAFPVLCHLLLLRKLNVDSGIVWSILFINRLFVVIVFFIVALILRQHLFIWTVFAPKLLIESCFTLILFIEMLVFRIFKVLFKKTDKYTILKW